MVLFVPVCNSLLHSFSGLKLNVQSQIATMPFRRPADTDPEAVRGHLGWCLVSIEGLFY